MTNEEKLQKFKEAREQINKYLPNDKIILLITEKDEWLKEQAKEMFKGLCNCFIGEIFYLPNKKGE